MKDPREKQILEMLLSRYRADQKSFRSFLPEVAQLLDAKYPLSHSYKSPFGLTERERAHREMALRRILQKLAEDSLSQEEAVKGLEHCAALIQDDSLPEDVGYQTLVGLAKAVIGKSPGSFKSRTAITVKSPSEGDAFHRISLVRGVDLALDRNMGLVSVTIAPGKVKERRKLLSFVGTGRDTAKDVALRHDDYLAERGSHAPA